MTYPVVIAGGPPRIAKPTLFAVSPDTEQAFRDVGALCRAIHRLRGNRGLRVADALVAVSDREPADGFTLWAVDPDTGAEDWIGVAAPQLGRAAFLQALADVHPHKTANGRLI